MIDFVRKKSTGLFSNISVYRHPNPEMPEVRLFPMIHIGESEFYDEIRWEQRCCDTVLMEGAVGWPAKLATRLYGYIASLKHIALDRQGKSSAKSRREPLKWSRPSPDSPLETTVNVARYHAIECLPKRVRYVRADLDIRQTRSIFRKIPLMTWLVVVAGAIFALLLARTVSRKLIIETASDTICQNSRHHSSDFPERYLKHFEDYLLDARDAFLSQTLIREIQCAKKRKHVIGICYGAAHMESLHRLLSYDLGYRKPEQREVLAVAAQQNHIGSPEDGYGFANKAFRKLVNLEFKPKRTDWTEKLTKTRKKKVPTRKPRLRFNYQLENPLETQWKQNVSVVVSKLKMDEAA